MKIKTLSALIFFLFLFAAGYSQTEKGTFALSGKTDLNFLLSNTTLSRDSIDSDKTKSNQYGFTVGFGYFIANNFMIGLSGAYSYVDSKIESPASIENITSTLAVIPQLSYYFPLEGNLKPLLTIGVGYLLLRERDSRATGNNNVVYSLSGPSYSGAAGVAYFITQSVAFDLGIQYAHNRLKDKEKSNEIQKQNIVAGNFGVSIFF
jgi:outer membrane protein